MQSGDSVIAIAAKYGSTVKDIISTNNLSADGRLSVGQELLIPIPGPSGGPGPTATPGTTGLMYNVQSGDTISGLATRYKSQVDWILEANNMKASDTLRIGQPLLIPLVPATPTPVPTALVTPLLPTPTEIPGLSAPQLLMPGDAATISGQDSVLLSWTSVGVLAPEEWYVVTLKSPEKATAIASWWTKNSSWRLPVDYRPTGQRGTGLHLASAGAPRRAGSPGRVCQSCERDTPLYLALGFSAAKIAYRFRFPSWPSEK